MEFSSVNTIWVLIGSAMIFFMQAGFAMLETGMTRAKNSGNIIMKNLMDFCIGSVMFWVVGFGIMYGGNGLIFGSIKGAASAAAYGTDMLPDGVPFWAFLISQTVFAATAATIVSGAMAERTKFLAYCIYSAVISLIIYPLSGHWIWGGGWLESMGFHDLAGSTAVHLVGASCALVGAIILGPRIGKYSRSGKSKVIMGQSIPLAALGIFILWFSWFGFNGSSTVSMEGNKIELAGKIFFNTNISAAISACTVMIITWIKYKKPDVTMSLNGVLGGLVAITAGCDTMSSGCSALTGIIAGFIVVFGVEMFDKFLRIDDPVGAIAVHGGCGLWGTIAVGLFSDATSTKVKGLLMGGGFSQFGIQVLGAVVVFVYVVAAAGIMFAILNKTCGIRVSSEAEIEGLDRSEHNIENNYSEFLSSDGVSAPIMDVPKIIKEKWDNHKNDSEATPMSKIVIIAKQNKLDTLLHSLNSIGVTGVTITNVTGYGIQKGNTKYYRSSEMDINLLPKVKIEIVVSTVPVSTVISTVEKVLYTGNYGDGKIFVYDIRNVVKVRTGEEGPAALVDVGDE